MQRGKRRVIAVGLDGFEISIARAMMRDGGLPAFQELERNAALFALDHGSARETGLAWEHFSTGREPDAYERWSAVNFDPKTYAATQDPTREQPFLPELGCSTVAFDVPYLSLPENGPVVGMANWGAHDPGVPRHAAPASLDEEIEKRFGGYPAGKFIYGFVWPSADKTAEMADRMTEAVQRRSAITQWLLRERFPDWTLGITVVAELHSAAEALWHGWDPQHPLHGHASAAEARRGLESVYRETDTMIRALQQDHPDAALFVFSMHGMGPNTSDLLSMALLPELMYRRSFGTPYLHPNPGWTLPLPLLRPEESWSSAILERIGEGAPGVGGAAQLTSKLKRAARRLGGGQSLGKSSKPEALPWMPAAHYNRFWPKMEAFALPAFYDGQIRINLKNREAGGLVAENRYAPLLDELEDMLRQATNPVTGEGLVARIERPLAEDPYDRSETRCDLKILWRTNANAMKVDPIGVVGPVPQRRTGGHTGAFGYAAIAGDQIQGGDKGVASAFDVVPTLFKMLDRPYPDRLSGRSLL